MACQRINGWLVEVVIINPDGTATGGLLDAREAWTVAAVDTVLEANDVFQQHYPQAVLIHVEAMRGLPETARGRYYLRYHSSVGVTEFWGYLTKRAEFNFKRGLVGVAATADMPAKWE
jgi:hypothetical protein